MLINISISHYYYTHHWPDLQLLVEVQEQKRSHLPLWRLGHLGLPQFHPAFPPGPDPPGKDWHHRHHRYSAYLLHLPLLYCSSEGKKYQLKSFITFTHMRVIPTMPPIFFILTQGIREDWKFHCYDDWSFVLMTLKFHLSLAEILMVWHS